MSQFVICDAHWEKRDVKYLENIKIMMQTFFIKNETHQTNIYFLHGRSVICKRTPGAIEEAIPSHLVLLHVHKT